MVQADIHRTLTLPAKLDHLQRVSEQISELLGYATDIPEHAVIRYNIQLAAQEICVNIVEHAYAGIPDGQITIQLMLDETPLRLRIELHDTGHSFDPSLVPFPNLNEAHEHGYGIFLAHALLDEVCYTSSANGNTWRLTKYLEE